MKRSHDVSRGEEKKRRKADGVYFFAVCLSPVGLVGIGVDCLLLHRQRDEGISSSRAPDEQRPPLYRVLSARCCRHHTVMAKEK